MRRYIILCIILRKRWGLNYKFESEVSFQVFFIFFSKKKADNLTYRRNIQALFLNRSVLYCNWNFLRSPIKDKKPTQNFVKYYWKSVQRQIVLVVGANLTNFFCFLKFLFSRLCFFLRLGLLFWQRNLHFASCFHSLCVEFEVWLQIWT